MGDVCHDDAAQGLTRFILRLPQVTATVGEALVRNAEKGICTVSYI